MTAIAENPPSEEKKVTPEKPAEAKPAEKTVEKPGDAASSFLSKMKAGKEAMAKEKAAAKPAEEKKADKPAETKAKLATTPKLVESPALDATAIAEAAGRGVAAEFNRREESSKEKKVEKADELEGLSDDERETADVLKRMEKDYPAIYANRTNEYVASVRAAQKYQKGWEAANAGKKFDPEAEEHNDFFAANDVDWNDFHFNKALAKIEGDKSAAKVSENGNAKLKEIEKKEKLREAEPAINASQRDAAITFFSDMGEGFENVLEGGNKEVNRIIDADPLKESIFIAANNVKGFASEWHKLTGGLVECVAIEFDVQPDGSRTANPHYDPKSPLFKAHSFMLDFVRDTESNWRNMPRTSTLDDDGRVWVGASEYNQMTEDQRRKHWRFSEKDIADIYARSEAKKVKSFVAAEEKRIESIASKRGYVKNVAATSATNGNGKAHENGDEQVEKPVSVASTVEPRMTPARGGSVSGEKTAVASFLSRLR